MSKKRRLWSDVLVGIQGSFGPLPRIKWGKLFDYLQLVLLLLTVELLRLQSVEVQTHRIQP